MHPLCETTFDIRCPSLPVGRRVDEGRRGMGDSFTEGRAGTAGVADVGEDADDR